MTHAVIVPARPEKANGKLVKAELTGERKICLEKREYTLEELALFRAESANWLLQRAGSHQFTADSESGEDAWGYYCGYFDWNPENAIFENGRLVGFVLRENWMHYSGSDRASYNIDDWGYPGEDPFTSVPLYGKHIYAFLFAEAESHKHRDWKLLKREPGAEYGFCLEF